MKSSSELMTRLSQEEVGLGYFHSSGFVSVVLLPYYVVIIVFCHWICPETSDYPLRESAGRGPFNCVVYFSVTYGAAKGLGDFLSAEECHLIENAIW